MTCRLLFLVFLLLIPANDAISQGGKIVVASDPVLGDLGDCYIGDEYQVVTSVYVMHVRATEAMGARFSITTLDSYNGGGMTMTIVGESALSNLTIGNIETGIEVVYVGCKPLPHVVYRIDYMGSGTSASCSVIAPAPHHEDSVIEVRDCSNDVLEADCSGVYVNGDYNDCYCHNGSRCVPWVVPTEPTSWGAIKALYRNASNQGAQTTLQ